MDANSNISLPRHGSGQKFNRKTGETNENHNYTTFNPLLLCGPNDNVGCIFNEDKILSPLRNKYPEYPYSDCEPEMFVPNRVRKERVNVLKPYCSRNSVCSD